MAQPMGKRERVERTMALQETDRVPIYDLLRCDSMFEHFSGRKLPPLAEDDRTRQVLLEIVGEAVNRFCDMTRNVGFGPVVEKDTSDDFGFVNHSDPREKTSWIAARPFHDEDGAIAFLERYLDKVRRETREIGRNPSKHRDEYHREFLKTQAAIGDTVNLLAVQGVGLDEVRNWLGLELFSYVEADQPGLVGGVLEAVTDFNVAVCHSVADWSLSPCVLTYGDIACKGRLLHSPEWLRREFLPRLKRLNDAWHEHGLKCLFHSDGYLMEVMDDLIDAGIDGLNPIETVAGMDLKETKAKYGDRIFLTGGIDMSQLLSLAEPDEVREVCRRAVRDASPGYFMGSTTEVDNCCRLENIVAMYKVAMESGESPTVKG